MSDVQKPLERQAKWQKSRAALSWPEKIRMAEAMRESVRQLRASVSPEEREAARRRRAPPASE